MTTVSNQSPFSDRMRSASEFGLSGDNSQALARATETWFVASAECQREMMSFMSMRTEKDGEIAREVLSCRNLADLTAIQSRWLEETVRDYNSETTKLMGIYTKSVKVEAISAGDRINPQPAERRFVWIAPTPDPSSTLSRNNVKSTFS